MAINNPIKLKPRWWTEAMAKAYDYESLDVGTHLWAIGIRYMDLVEDIAFHKLNVNLTDVQAGWNYINNDYMHNEYYT